MTFGSIAATIGSIIVGGAVATITIVSLVSSQTSADGRSPANADNPVVQYGTIEPE